MIAAEPRFSRIRNTPVLPLTAGKVHVVADDPVNTYIESVFVNVNDDAPLTTGVPISVGMILLVNVCVSVVPTTVPVGAVTAVIADVPLPFTSPVRVAAPVPPPATGSPVQLVNVPLDGVPSTGVVRVGLVNVLLVRVSVDARPTRVSEVAVAGRFNVCDPDADELPCSAANPVPFQNDTFVVISMPPE